jgi:hypothetical protein
MFDKKDLLNIELGLECLIRQIDERISDIKEDINFWMKSKNEDAETNIQDDKETLVEDKKYLGEILALRVKVKALKNRD